MKKTKMAFTDLDGPIRELAAKADHPTLAIWAADCAERALPFFAEARPQDDRPSQAIRSARDWARTRIFSMARVRAKSQAAHAAAHEVEEYTPARSAARAAGQAAASAHVGAHAVAAAIYAATAARDSAEETAAQRTALEEREWQYQHLRELRAQADGWVSDSSPQRAPGSIRRRSKGLEQAVGG